MTALFRAAGLALLFSISAAGAQPPLAGKVSPPKAPPALVQELSTTFARLKSLLQELQGIRAKAMGTAGQAERAALVSRFNTVKDQFIRTRTLLLDKVEKAHKAYPSDPGVCKIHIQFALGRKDWKSALADSKVLLQASPKDKDLVGQQAYIFLQLGRLEDTVAQLHRLRKLTGNKTQEAPLLTQCLANMGRYDQALAEIASFRKATGDPA
ncbi:MAG TPA: hypothetical protein ENJ97_08200, partial [Planctomycetes bacterium]|nr:hypothetical protein [Planctomycetota bacterium]